MSHPRLSRIRSLVVLIVVLGSSLATTGVARASFGQIARFGGPGDQTSEKFSEATPLGELTPTVYGEIAGSVRRLFLPWHIIGVEPKTNDVYVVEEYKPPKETESEKWVRFLRLQEFNTKGELLAHVEFTNKTPEENYSEEENGVEGVVVDPQKERLYFLVNDRREEFVPEEEEAVAGSLYAFSTKLTKKNTKGEFEFEPASGTSSKEPGVLDNTAALAAFSSEPGKALLSPHGITLDPETHQVVILAHDDTCAEPAEECEEDELESPDDHYVAQRVNGETGALEARYEDGSSMRSEQSGSVEVMAPSSPVVTGPAGHERLLASDFLEQEEQEGKRSEEEILDEFPGGTSARPAHLEMPDLGDRFTGLGRPEQNATSAGKRAPQAAKKKLEARSWPRPKAAACSTVSPRSGNRTTG